MHFELQRTADDLAGQRSLLTLALVSFLVGTAAGLVAALLRACTSSEGSRHGPVASAVLERCPEKLARMRLSAVSWYDLGTPERVVQTINELGIRPEWRAALQGVGDHRRAARTNARTRMAAHSLFMPALFLH
jgi:hypothetical protein